MITLQTGNGIEPETRLRHVISVISVINTWPANRVKELLPWHVNMTSTIICSLNG